MLVHLSGPSEASDGFPFRRTMSLKVRPLKVRPLTVRPLTVRSLTVVLVAVSAVAAACSSGGSGGAGEAKGPPLVVGFVNQENSPSGSFPEVRADAEAAVRYV